MADVKNASTTHFLRLGPKVPDYASNLGLVRITPPDPGDVIRVANIGDEISGNQDTAIIEGAGGYAMVWNPFFLPGGPTSDYGSRQIRATKIVELHNRMWFLMIRPGHFSVRENGVVTSSSDVPSWVQSAGWGTVDVLWFYGVPEYGAFPYSNRKNMWEMPIGQQGIYAFEEPELIDDTTIRVANTPLVANPDVAPEVRLNGYDYVAHYGGTVTIENVYDGTIKLSSSITPDADVRVGYYYHEFNYLFTGNWGLGSAGWLLLDLNPQPGHVCAIETATGTENVPTKDVLVTGYGDYDPGALIYARPVAAYNIDGQAWATPASPIGLGWTFLSTAMKGAGLDYLTLGYGYLGSLYLGLIAEWQSSAFLNKVYDHTETLIPKAILIARVYCNYNYNINMIALMDTRSRGGGLKRDAALWRYPESEFYWEIGTLDGGSVSDAGVLIVRVPRTVINKLTEKYVRSVIESYLGAGIAYLLEAI